MENDSVRLRRSGWAGLAGAAAAAAAAADLFRLVQKPGPLVTLRMSTVRRRT
jgi:hypothetical protein